MLFTSSSMPSLRSGGTGDLVSGMGAIWLNGMSSIYFARGHSIMSILYNLGLTNGLPRGPETLD